MPMRPRGPAGQGLSKKERVLLRRYVAPFRRSCAAVGEDLLAFVAGVVGVVPGEGVFRDETVVLAAAARQPARGVGGRGQQAVEACGRLLLRGGTGVQCASVGPHQFRHVAARYFRTGEQFQRPYDRIVAHGTSLHHYPVAQFFAFLQFQNLVEAVLDHRIGEPGCDIGHRSPFAEYLFHFGVHEDRTARAQVARPLGKACLRREIGDRIPQRVGECLDEGAAAR